VCVAAFTYLTATGDAFFGACVIFVILYATIVTYREGVFTSCALAFAYAFGHAFVAEGSLLGIALVAMKTLSLVVIGVIVATSVEGQRRHEHELEVAAHEHELVNEQLQRRISELQAVSEITELIHSSLDFDEVGLEVVAILAKVIDIDALCIFVLDSQKSDTLFSASVGVDRAAGQTMNTRLQLRDVESYFTCLRVFDHGSMMVLACAEPGDIERLTDDDRLVVNAVASELVVAVENSQLYKLTKRLSITDELTGMFNYRYLQQRLDDEINRAKRYDKAVSLLMMDADEFKHFNDRYGHIAGDRALAEFRSVLGGVLREVDVVARYGGEEFAVVLPETDAAGAFVAAEKIREAIGAHAFGDENGARCCTLTVSIGVATYPTYAQDKESLLRQADDALYRAKNGGKNRVRAPKTRPESPTSSGE
jgi:diguanylate cyclase (GGDEF)-like protein